MKTLALGVLAAAVIAILAGLAIWPAVADAPWEQEASAPVIEDGTDEIRCEGALNLRLAVIESGIIRISSGSLNNPGDVGGGILTQSEYNRQLAQAEREIDRYR